MRNRSSRAARLHVSTHNYDRVRRAEDLGFHSISVPDHLGPNLPQLAPIVALAAAATVTSRIRLAMTVIDNDFRHPVMLAKEIGTLDLMSEGRVDLGLGAGWHEDDYTRTGVATWDPPGTRVHWCHALTATRDRRSADARFRQPPRWRCPQT